MLILGLNMFHADASAAIVQDGEVVFRDCRRALEPHQALRGCSVASPLRPAWTSSGAKITDVDHVAVGQDGDANLAKKVRIRACQSRQDSELHPPTPTQATDARLWLR
jgi:carbamoyltransferase